MRLRPHLLPLFLAVLLVTPSVAADGHEATAAGGQEATATTYVIQPGDTLSRIARHHGVAVADLVDANDLADPDRIVAGATLVIPGADDEGRLPSRWHLVERGESLGILSARYGIPVETLFTANALSERMLRVGQQISLTPVLGPVPGAGATHVVGRGDTLSAIARAMGTSVARLVEVNGLTDPNHIEVGQRLVLPGWHCPIGGPVAWVNDFGYTKPSGRVHEGIDLHAKRGTPVVAPVAGVVDQVDGDLGGLQSWLVGNDGVTYIASHLDTFVAASGRVEAGAVLGTVGTSGNAEHTAPHVHFEMHPQGAGPVNPRHHLEASC